MSEDAKTENEVVLTTALHLAYQALNDLIDECIPFGIPVTPTRQAIAKARRILPARFKHSFVEKSKLATDGGYSIFSHAQNGHDDGDSPKLTVNLATPKLIESAIQRADFVAKSSKRQRGWAVEDGLGLGPPFKGDT